jgi:hypothetical protein
VATLNRLVEEPSSNSRDMRAYMQAILEVTGLFAGQDFPLELFMRNYATHLAPKVKYPHAMLVKASNGLYSLTPEGATFFRSRLTSAPAIAGQKVGRDNVVSMLRCILASSPPPGWQSFEVPLSANA